jgi:tRNA (adenine57-N1/adenine58-N1)-methyltransferase
MTIRPTPFAYHTERRYNERNSRKEQPLSNANDGDLALFVNLRDDKRYLVRLKAGSQHHTNRGIVPHDAIIGQPWGRIVLTQMGAPFLVLEPSTSDLIRHIKRSTQILFPKDIGYILLKLSVRPGKLILEAGTGSGGMTLALALATAPLGHIVTYEIRPEFHELAKQNIERAKIPPGVVEFKLRDIAQGLDETDADAFFLDVAEPWNYLDQVAATLRGGGFFATLVATMNQVIPTVLALEQGPFGMIEVEELLLRPYKAVSSRVRPADRMVAHTGYLIFARKIDKTQFETAPDTHPEDVSEESTPDEE